MAAADPFEAYRQAVGAARGFEATVGYRIVVEAGVARVELDVDARHLNVYGAVHGGVTLTLLDVAGGVQVYLRARPARMATINLATQFLELVPETPVVAIGRIDRLGRRVAHTTIDLRAANGDGTLLATAVGSYRLFHADDTP